jgi:hypothetical protein
MHAAVNGFPVEDRANDRCKFRANNVQTNNLVFANQCTNQRLTEVTGTASNKQSHRVH